MESPGVYLKRERELRGTSLEDLSSRLNLSLKTLRALEADDYPSLPHPAYIKGFIKSYCRALGLDENDCVLRFEAYVKEKGEEKGGIGGEEEIRRAPRPDNTFTVIGLFVLGIAIIAVYFVLSRDTEDAVKPPEEANSYQTAPQGQKEEVPLKGPEAEPEKKEPVVLKEEVSKEMLTLDVFAKELTWIKVEMDGKEPFEVLLKEGERVSWTASEVFF